MKTYSLWLTLIFGLLEISSGQEAVDSPLPGFDPSGMIRFESVSQAERRRESLHKYIWPEGLPATRPKIQSLMNADELSTIAPELIDHVERMDITVGKFDFVAVAFRVLPKASRQPAFRFIVHHGHVPDGPEHYLDAGVKETVEFLLLHGCEVVLMQMPLVGWNHDADGIYPDQTPFEIEARGTSGHRELFDQLEPHLHGQTFRLFLEPIIQVVNELSSRGQPDDQLHMIGLSGGGWATHMAAAVDTRIQCSIPVAGAMPLYARAYSPGSKGDTEQYYTPLYREVDQNGDGVPETAAGVASWFEIFALGAIGGDQPRKQIQVLNLYDSCCFSGEIYRTYDQFLTDKIRMLNAGSWSVFIDRTHREHLISKQTLETVVAPLLEATKP
jgi:hypothetical protein